MWRYLKAAFWAKVAFHAVGPIPVNALALFGVGALGMVEPSLWLLGAGLETAYLFVVANSPRFRKVVDGQDLVAVREQEVKVEEDLEKALLSFDPALVERHRQVDRTIASVREHYRAQESDSALFESNLETLVKLSALHLQLAVAQGRLDAAESASSPEGQQAKKATLERELASPQLPEALRESKRATLDLVERRLTNSQRRREQIAEIAANLERIETQVNLALDDASSKGAPAAVHVNLEAYDQIITSNQQLATLYQAQ